MHYINLIITIKHRNKTHKNFKHVETKFLDGTDVSYASVYATMYHVVYTADGHWVLKERNGIFD